MSWTIAPPAVRRRSSRRGGPPGRRRKVGRGGDFLALAELFQLGGLLLGGLFADLGLRRCCGGGGVLGLRRRHRFGLGVWVLREVFFSGSFKVE